MEGKQCKATLKYTDEDVDQIIDRKFARWQKQQEKAIDQARESEQMEAQRRLMCERKEYLKKLEEYRRKDILDDMARIAQKILNQNVENQEETL